MAAVKAYFYRLRDDLPDVCEGVDIPAYLEELRLHFGRAALHTLDPATPIPEGPLFYSDTPRNCHASPGKYEIEDAISDCLRLFDKKGRAKKALAEMIAEKAVSNPAFREGMLAYQKVPQSWLEILQPPDPEEKPDRKKIADALISLQDRDFSHKTNAKGDRHPLARITEMEHFTATEKLGFIADYFIGRQKREAPWAVRLGSSGNYTELNQAQWLERNSAFILKTVGDIIELKKHFTATNKLKRGAVPDLPQLEPGDLKLEIK